MPNLPRQGLALLFLVVFMLVAALPSAGQGTSSPPDSAKPNAAAVENPDLGRIDAPAPSPAPPAETLDESRDDAPARPHPPAPAEQTGPVRARFKSDLVLPFGSVFLPGFGQSFQGEWSALAYSGTALAGLSVLIASEPEAVRESVLPSAGRNSGWWPYRTFELGGLAYQGSGFLSAYSAFRSSVPRFQDEDGRYRFLGPRESVGELMLSPFRFGQLTQPSAWIPLGLLAGGVGTLVAYERTHPHRGHWSASPDDYLFVGSESWNAGVSEEAVFRGWIYPVSYQYLWYNFWLADGAQALLFGAAHFDRHANPVPWPQAMLGFYFGWMARKNGWTLSESVFVHAWWDMLLFAGAVATQREIDSPASFRIALPLTW